jgi:hypothetical protein
MQTYPRMALAGRDRAWMEQTLAWLRHGYGEAPRLVTPIITSDVNAPAKIVFVRQQA